MSAADEFFFERGVVLNDAVMNHGDIVRTGRMRVRVILARFTMGRPTCMANAARAIDIHALNHGLKAGDLANLVLHVEAQRRLHGDACRIVAAVFHALQAANQNVLRLQASGVSNDAAHREIPFLIRNVSLTQRFIVMSGKPRKGRSSQVVYTLDG